MITDLSTKFKALIDGTTRSPVQLCHLHRAGKIYFFSDAPVGIRDGLLYDYEPLIEDWGAIKDTSYLNSSFSGNSLEIKTATLSLILTGDYRDVLLSSIKVSLDNTVVELYQWFRELPNEAPQLMDVMLVQDPIKFSEKSSILKIDLVSVLMRNNPYLWAREAGAETRDIVVGKMTNMPLYNQQTSRVTALSQDLEFDYTGQVFIDNGVGFRAGPDTMTIDSEIVAYDWISASAINITGRAQGGTTARPHIRGALICHPDAVFDYSICAGPVQSVDNLIGNGELYTQPVTFYPGQDPVTARFIGRPPWLKVSPGVGGPPITPDPETSTEYGASIDSSSGEGAGTASSGSSINSAAGSAAMTISSTVGGGPGSVLKSKVSPYENVNIESYPNSSQLYGVDQFSSFFGTYGKSILFDDNIKGHRDQLYSVTETGLGTLTGLTVSVEFKMCQVKKAEGTLNIYFVKANGTTVLLDTDTLSEYGTQAVQFKFSNEIVYFDVKNHVANFAELASCRVRVECVNINSATEHTFEGVQVEFNMVRWNVSYFIDAGTVSSPWQQLYSHFNRNLSSYGGLTSIYVQVRFNASITNAEVYQAVMYNGSVLWSRTISGSQGAATVTVYPNITSFSSLQGAKIGVYQQIVGPETEGVNRQLSTSFEYVRWVISYQPGQIETPDEERVVYAEDLICDVTSNLGADPTPAQVIQHLIEDHSTNGAYIDTFSFEDRHAEYVADNYYFNGVLKGNIRLHEALKQCLKEGMGRFLFSEGSIALLNYSTYASTYVDYSVSEDEYVIKSKAQDNQPTSSIINDSTVMHLYNPSTDEFEGKVNDVDDESIAIFQRHETRGEYTLIRSADIANKVSEYQLDRLSKPITVLSFQMFMSGYVLQKGDRIHFHTMTKGYKAVGHVASVDRVVGQGKNDRINKFLVRVADAVSTTKVLDIADIVFIDDSLLELGGATTRLNLSDDFVVDDTAYRKAFHLGLVDSVVVDDSDLELSTTKRLLLTDSIELTEAMFAVRAIRLELTDQIEVDDTQLNKSLNLALTDSVVVDDEGYEGTTAKRLKLFDNVIIEDTNLTADRLIHLRLTEAVVVDDTGIELTTKLGYGAGGYGDNNGYGN